MSNMPPQTPGMFIGQVLRNRTPCREHFELTLLLAGFPEAVPGQFVQIRCAPADTALFSMMASSRGDTGGPADPPIRHKHLAVGPTLRRPFSIAGLRRSGDECELDILGRVVGLGTDWLAELGEGDTVDVLGPLGRGFSVPASTTQVILVAGGVGLPPIRWLGEELRRRGVACLAIYGATTRSLLPITLIREPSHQIVATRCVDQFARHAIDAIVTTDDGTCGVAGRVTDAVVRFLDADPRFISSGLRVYGCGPEPMLRRLAAICGERGISCEIAMERMMGCGMGTCQSCVVRVVDRQAESGWRYALCCTDGPVFDAAAVQWSSSIELPPVKATPNSPGR